MDSDYELQLVALGLCLASPKLLGLVTHESFDEPEIARLIASLKEKALGDKKPSNADRWFEKRNVAVNGSVSESVLETVKLHARWRRAVKLSQGMAAGGKVFPREEYIERLKKEADKL